MTVPVTLAANSPQTTVLEVMTLTIGDDDDLPEPPLTTQA